MAQTLFDDSSRRAILDRIARLDASAVRQWGKMTPAQMLTHCSLALEAATGETPSKQALLGKVFAPFVRKGLLGDKPFSRNSPTNPAFVVSDERDFAKERERLLGMVALLVARGPERAAAATHMFFGKLSGDEWGRLMYKHLDHHLVQFGG